MLLTFPEIQICFKFLSPDVLSSFGKKKTLNTVCSCYFTSVIAKEIVTIASKTIMFSFLTAVLSIEHLNIAHLWYFFNVQRPSVAKVINLEATIYRYPTTSSLVILTAIL